MPQQQCHIFRVVTVKGKPVKPLMEKGIPLDVRVYKEEEIEGGMKYERIALESLAGTVSEAPGSLPPPANCSSARVRIWGEPLPLKPPLLG